MDPDRAPLQHESGRDSHILSADDLADDLADDPVVLDEAEHHALEDEPEATLPAISDPIGTARRRHGAAGAILAAGMFGVDVALGRKPKEDAPIVIAASDQPTDIDTEGIEIPVDDTTSVYVPPQPKADPLPPRRRRKPAK